MLDAGLGLGLGELGVELGLGGCRGDVDDEDVRVDGERRAAGQLEVAGVDLRAGVEALDRDLEGLGDVGRLGLDGDRRVLEDDEVAADGVADDVDADVDGDLLALA